MHMTPITKFLENAGIHNAEDSDQAGEQAEVDFEDDDETDDEEENYLTDDSYDPDNMTYEVIMTRAPIVCILILESRGRHIAGKEDICLVAAYGSLRSQITLTSFVIH